VVSGSGLRSDNVYTDPRTVTPEPAVTRATPALLVALLATPSGRADDPPARPVVPLKQAHAHNDYEHSRPLLDALSHGFCSVEADVFLTDGQLLVAHFQFQTRPGRTLEKLYLDPLRERVKANGGAVYPGGPPFYLLIDVKTDAEATYAALDKVLAKYADILSVTKDGKFEPKAVTVVISGNRAKATIAKQAVRYAGIDGRPEDLGSGAPAHLIPWISASWASEFRWKGDGPMPEAERRKLKDMVARAHERGRLVRFWATPESETVWAELLDAGVDLINTDRLADLQKFLLANPRPKR
jgi:glycerophosphoryl diester phosphodiesterase